MYKFPFMLHIKKKNLLENLSPIKRDLFSQSLVLPCSLYCLCVSFVPIQHLFCFPPIFLMFDHLFFYSPSLANISFKENLQVKMCLQPQQSWQRLGLPPCKLKTTLLWNPSCLFLWSQHEDRWWGEGADVDSWVSGWEWCHSVYLNTPGSWYPRQTDFNVNKPSNSSL